MKSFGRLERLAERPKLARHVKKFVYLMPYLYFEGKAKALSKLNFFSDVNSENR